jgi:hypothetical protein
MAAVALCAYVRQLPPLTPPRTPDRHQERQRHQDPRRQRQLVDAGHRIPLVAPPPEPVRAASAINEGHVYHLARLH